MKTPNRRVGAAVSLFLGLLILRGLFGSLSQVKLNFNAVEEGVSTENYVRSDTVETDEVPPSKEESIIDSEPLASLREPSMNVTSRVGSPIKNDAQQTTLLDKVVLVAPWSAPKPELVWTDRSAEEQQSALSRANCSGLPFDASWKHNHTFKTVWVPSYPGSGAEMFRVIMESITGMRSDEINAHGCKDNPPTCKTHWPAYDQHKRDLVQQRMPEFHDKAFMLIRNPRRSIPSWFNWRWEKENHVASHSQVAPVSEWVEWRNKHFHVQLHKWASMLEKWVAELPRPKMSLFVPYEEMTDSETGPAWMEKIHSLLHEQSGMPLTEVDTLPCIWFNVVKGGGTKKMKRKGGGYVPSFSSEHKTAFLNEMDALSQKFATDNPQLARLLSSYRDDIERNLPLDASIQRF